MMVSILIIVLGLIIGSFLNVVIYRFPRNESIVFPASHCPNCGTQLKVLDLMPIFSFILSKGRCRYCKEKISYQYPLVELLTSFFFFGLYYRYGISIYLFIYLILTTMLIVSSFIDLNYQIIPNKITYLGIMFGFIISFIFSHLTIKLSFLGIVLPALFLLLIIFITRGGMGMGDVKLVAMIGSFIGPLYTFFSIFIGAFLGSVVGLILIGMKLKDRKSRIAFGPFIAAGSLLMILYGEKIINWYF